jgi:alpha-1,6-mannosyltransferase
VPPRTLLLGLAGAVLLVAGAFGAGGVQRHDPLISDGPLAWLRFGHGYDLAVGTVYLGFGMMVWAWVKLGRHILAHRVGVRAALVCATAWTVPMLISPPLFTRDVYSYLAQGSEALRGIDPYKFGPRVLTGPVADNVHYFWQNTPSPYGPLFVGLAKGVYLVAGENVWLGLLLMRLALLAGWPLLLWAMPRLTAWLGGRLPVALWLTVASPMWTIHLVGGPHNDLLMVGLMAAGTALVLQRRHAGGIALVTAATAIKATAGIALPFLIWVWAAHGTGSPRRRFARAAGGGVAVFVVVFGVLTVAAKVNLGWIPALSAPTAIVNWLSVPTAAGQLTHGIASLFVTVGDRWFVLVTRGLGIAAAVLVLLRQWWLARHGGPDAVRRAAIALVAVAVLSPAILPWYLTWSLVLAAGLPWHRRGLLLAAGGSTWLVLVAYPDGEIALYHPVYVLGALAVSALAAVSLVRPDPLRLFSSARRDDPPPPLAPADPGDDIGPGTGARSGRPAGEPAAERVPADPAARVAEATG